MMRLFPNGFGGFDLVEEDGLLGLGGLVGGLGVSFWRRSVLAGWLTMAVTDYFLCLALNTYTLAGDLDFGSLVTWLESPFLAVLVPLINLAAVTAPLVFLSAPYLAALSLWCSRLEKNIPLMRKPGSRAMPMITHHT